MIKFGTDGWRDIIAQNFTFANVKLATQAVVEYIRAHDDPGRGVVVGYDTRFLSREFASTVADVLSANGIRVFLADDFVPTPAVSYLAAEWQTAGGIMITSSHNPAIYNGFKFKAPYGGSASPEIIKQIEAKLAAITAADVATGARPELIETRDFKAPYLAALEKLVDMPSLVAANLHLVLDPMYGSGQGYLTSLLDRYGISYTAIRHEQNPNFPGICPEPIDQHLEALFTAVRAAKAEHPDKLVSGLATDGDADRIGAADSAGNFVNSHRILALLLRHLYHNRGWRGDVVKTFSGTCVIDRLCAKYGLKLYTTPIGFKHICDYMVGDYDILIGGEESGGIGVKNYIPERDGLLNSLLLAELMAKSGMELGELVCDLQAEVGVYHYDRIDLALTSAQKEAALVTLQQNRPSRIGDFAVSDFSDLDGYKFFFGEDGWLLVRPSGTEPVLRIYCEHRELAAIPAIFTAIQQLLNIA